MNILVGCFVLALALASDGVRYGTLHIYQVGHKPVSLSLIAANDTIYASKLMSVFTYDGSGLWSQSAKKYVSTDDSGKLVLVDKEDGKFFMSDESSSSKGRKILFYRNSEVFDLCEDNSIGHNSKCTGAKKVSLTYDDIFE